MSVTPRECRDAPGVYSVCLNDVCFPVTNAVVGNYLKQYETTGDCVVDESDFYVPEEVVGADITGQVLANSGGDKSLAVADAYVNAMINTSPNDYGWRRMGSRGLDLYTKWASHVRDLDKALDTVYSATTKGWNDPDGDSRDNPAVLQYLSFKPKMWRDVVAKTIGAEGDIANNFSNTACLDFKDLIDDNLQKQGKTPHESSYMDMETIGYFLSDLPDELRGQGTLYMDLFFKFQDMGFKTFLCEAEGCPDVNSAVTVNLECSWQDQYQ
ncbi:MAG: hypothetical protein HYT75_08105 [Deltaproteobacteria bacterium]|nr:hypothetical protein [Deltaproteobacteria bacterium]MBI2341986.1 hypothetical protein [Deltaproteobacteria bacterium]